MSASDATAGPDVPDLVPARMFNEFCYSLRLFFLEWVQSRFAEPRRRESQTSGASTCTVGK